MKKGFTLVELLGVITILSVVAVLVVPVVDNIISKNKTKLYNIQIKNIEISASDWGTDHMDYLPEENNGVITISLGQLKKEGYVEEDLKNPKTNKDFSNDMLITVTKKSETYLYEVVEESGTDIDYNEQAPNIILNGSGLQYVEINTPYIELGAVATSYNGINLPNIDITGTVNTSLLGTYSVTYSIIDNGITNKVVRQVKVTDTISPTLTLSDVTINTSDGFNLMNDVSCTDNSNNCTITTSGNVLVEVNGTYYVTYKASDSSRNSITKTRKIIVDIVP